MPPPSCHAPPHLPLPRPQISAIYKDLTRSPVHPLGGQAYLHLEDEAEPYAGGIKFTAIPPAKRYREMEQLSGAAARGAGAAGGGGTGLAAGGGAHAYGCCTARAKGRVVLPRPLLREPQAARRRWRRWRCCSRCTPSGPRPSSCWTRCAAA
jgi:hypothetical protein